MSDACTINESYPEPSFSLASASVVNYDRKRCSKLWHHSIQLGNCDIQSGTNYRYK